MRSDLFNLNEFGACPLESESVKSSFESIDSTQTGDVTLNAIPIPLLLRNKGDMKRRKSFSTFSIFSDH